MASPLPGSDSRIPSVLSRIRNPRQRPRQSVPVEGDSLPHVVIVGGGFGGLNAAKALRDAPVRLTLVDKRNYHLFQPLLYQVATASLSPADIATPIRTVLRDQQNATVLLAEVRNVDLDRREVVMDDETLTYDYLILSAGAETNYFGKQEWDDLAPGLKSIEDAIEIRNRVFAAFELAERTDDEAERKRLLTFLVVGGGSTGVELAGALGEIAHFTLQREFRRIDPSHTRIILAHSRDRVLDSFPERLSRFAERELMRLGVEIRTGVRVTGIAPGAAWLGDQRIEAGTILWAAGVRASDLTRSPGLPIDRSQRVLVQPDLSIPGHPEAFAIGDMTAMSDRYGGPLPGVAPVAIQEASTAVANIQRRMRGEPTQRFTYHDRGVLATIGRNRAVAVIRGICLDGFFAWLVWAFVHIYTLIGYRNRIAVMSQWIWAYVTRQRSARLITEFHRAPVVDVLIHRAEPKATSAADREQARSQEPARSVSRE